jgi:quercetin dioxygenase-like cupin family protein
MVSAAGIETGTVLARRQRVGSSEISETVFAPGCRLSWHSHPHTCLAVVTRGAVRKRFEGVEEGAIDGTVVEMPAEERHEDLFGRDGARIVVLESESEPGTLGCFRDWTATRLAHCVSRELEMLMQDFSSPPSLSQIAGEIGLHPRSSPASFVPTTGRASVSTAAVSGSSGRRSGS